MCLTQEQLKLLVFYDENSGELIWKQNKGQGKKGNPIGTINGRGYKTVKINGKGYLVHRLIWMYFYGEFPLLVLDHIDRDKTNNKIENLREVSLEINLRNVNKRITNKVGHKGIHLYKGRYKVQASLDKVQRYLGTFSSLEEAKKVYEDFCKQNYKDYSLCSI